MWKTKKSRPATQPAGPDAQHRQADQVEQELRRCEQYARASPAGAGRAKGSSAARGCTRECPPRPRRSAAPGETSAATAVGPAGQQRREPGDPAEADEPFQLREQRHRSAGPVAPADRAGFRLVCRSDAFIREWVACTDSTRRDTLLLRRCGRTARARSSIFSPFMP